VSGDDVSKPIGQYNPTVFQITCKGKDSVYLGGVLAQERLMNVRNPTTKKLLLADSGWTPVPGIPGTAIFAYTNTGKILDQKGYPASPAVSALPANTGLLTCRQYIRAILFDPCGNPMTPIPLGAYNVTMTKDTQDQNGGTYKVTHK
jgi:hypothetical protein